MICGACGQIHVLGARQEYDQSADRLDWRPFLRIPHDEALEAQRARPAVREILTAYGLAKIERGFAQAARKAPKAGKVRLVDGGRLKLEGHGPDYRGER